jgi:hypothetical protein
MQNATSHLSPAQSLTPCRATNFVSLSEHNESSYVITTWRGFVNRMNYVSPLRSSLIDPITVGTVMNNNVSAVSCPSSLFYIKESDNVTYVNVYGRYTLVDNPFTFLSYSQANDGFLPNE